MTSRQSKTPTVAVIGAGPAGLMAAEVLSAGGAAVTVYERMPTVGRKLLMAGRGGLNLTHSEPLDAFTVRYGAQATTLRPILDGFPPAALTAWAEGLGQTTFTGSSGRVFPTAMKASPLLRAWLARLAAQGVAIRTRVRWTGWDADGALTFQPDAGPAEAAQPDAVILALGGASWPKLGSDGGWTGLFPGEVAPLRAANAGFDTAWSEVFRDRFAGAPLKPIALAFAGHTVRGEAMVTRYGLEGGGIYALAPQLRAAIEAEGRAMLELDLRPDETVARLTGRLGARPRKPGETASTYLRKAAHLSPVEIGLLREAHGVDLPVVPGPLARLIKRVPLTLTAIQPLARAISSAGGLSFAAVDDNLMLRARPGVFAAGEMLDWEAPTGGYLLQACFATGAAAARAALARLGL
jgi:uncharacterized flavoprotein (TIGR03862 family)